MGRITAYLRRREPEELGTSRGLDVEVRTTSQKTLFLFEIKKVSEFARWKKERKVF